MSVSDQPAAECPTSEDLIRDHQGPARSLARRFRGRESPDDLEGVALVALVAAAQRFDAERGVAFFSSYAVVSITGELKRHLRDRSWAIRVPRRLNELSLHLTQTEIARELGCSQMQVSRLLQQCLRRLRSAI